MYKRQGTGDTLTVGTSEVGSFSYYCVATNGTSGQKATSQTATVEVTEPKPDPTPDNTVTPTGKRGTGRLPKTSDPISVLPSFALGAAGAALVVAAAVLRTKRSGR